MSAPLLLFAALSLSPSAASEGSTAPAASQVPLDRLPSLLRERAGRPPQPEGSQAVLVGPGAPGVLLFSMDAVENAECVRAIPDVNGDGRDEVVVGIGISGQDNVFCLDGASSGTAAVLWSLQTTGGLSGGSCYGDQSLAVVSDTDGNRDANLLVGTAWGGRSALHLDTQGGEELWRFDTYLAPSPGSGWVYSLCEIGDVTGDGIPEFAFGTGSPGDSAYLIDGASTGGQATVLWRYAAGDAVYSVRNFGDANGDGTDDVLIAVGDNIDKLVLLEGDSALPGGNVIWSYEPGPSVYACGVLPDITGDGINEALAVLWTTLGSAVRCRNGATGAFLWNSSAIPEYAMAVDILEDVTGDGKHEIIVSSWENAVSVLSGGDGSLVWKTTVGTLNGGDVWTARAIADVTGDGVQDVIAGSFDTRVYLLDGMTGSIVWSYLTGNRVFSVAPAGDLDGDGWPDVLAGTQDTTSDTVVYVLEGDGGLLADRFPTFCDAQDGALASCPCANPGLPDTGCDIAQGTGGVRLDVLGQTSTRGNAATLLGLGYPPAASPTSIVIRAAALDPTSPVAFGDGLRCVGVPIARLAATNASGGSSTHLIGHGAGPGSFHYQLWFRNTPAGFCTPAAFNLSSGRTLTW